MELYHVLNRGVEKRKLFMEDGDRVRFVHDLYDFNDIESANNTSWRLKRTPAGIRAVRAGKNNDLRGRYSEERDQLVDIHGWCLMGNHYHLLLSERLDGGLTKFIMKLNVGYAKYFNEKYKRQGTLFQGRTKKIRITSDAYFLHILHYIHLNPLDFLKGSEEWRTLKIKNAATAMKHLKGYRWSSFLDYCGKKNFQSIITTELFGDVFGDYERAVRGYLKDIEVTDIKPFLLE